ncbi:hypothetical protein PTTG_26914 [Puccinia triticina 1-1 BBBD Race 1]|uniref:Uncharacterized protein n=1 Tax=Puccinia triticina (isolate 1-1 / race 1 (BBBD)) TaxID=630390 RepID=A0A180GQP8_PUCT1|nr:hypothetical protein PTTG_26914 [Puccinia triticina 1-1 BBBD Race 1]
MALGRVSAIFKKLMLCDIFEVNPTFSTMKHLIELLAQDQPHVEFLKELPDAVYPVIAKQTSKKKHGTSFLDEIQELFKHDLENKKESIYQQCKEVYLIAEPYLLRTIDILLKHGFCDKEDLRRLFQEDQILWSLADSRIQAISTALPHAKIQYSGTDPTENWFWPSDFQFLQGDYL